MIAIENYDFTWRGQKLSETADDEALRPHLRGITLNVRRGELIGVVGRVASGKTSLLSAIVGEMQRVAGDGSTCVIKARSLGYVPQQVLLLYLLP